MLDSANSDSLCVRFAFSAIAVAIEPGPTVSGMVSGKNARVMIAFASIGLTGVSPPPGPSGSFSICQPATATAKPPPIRSASIEIPKKCSTGVPAKNATISTTNALNATFLASRSRSCSVSASVRSRNRNAMPIGLMMPIRPVKPNRISEIRRLTIIG